MRKRWISLMCLIMGTAALWICGKYSEAVGMTADKNRAERTGLENTRLSLGEGEQGESGEKVSYEVYASQYTLDTGYTMQVFQVSGMEDKELEDKVNESLNSKLYILEEPWFLPENISENTPIIHYQTDRYLSVEYSFEYLAAYYQGSPSWHHCVTVDMQSGEVVYFDDLIDLSEAFAKKVKYGSVLHMDGDSFWMEEDNSILANRYARRMEIESILNAFQNFTRDFLYGDYYREKGYDMVYAYDTSAYQTVFYLEEGKICFTVPYDSVYEIEWILVDDIEDHLKVPKWTECSEHTGEEAAYGAELNSRYSCIAVEEGFEVTFFNSAHEIIFSECYPMEPAISQVTDNIFEVRISVGSPAAYVFYVDSEIAEISETFFNPLFIGERYIAYMEDSELILRDVFNDDLLCKAISRDFTKTANPMSAIIAIKMQDKNTITLSYYMGDNYEEISEIISIH